MHMPGLRNPTARQQAIMQLAGELAARFDERVGQKRPRSRCSRWRIFATCMSPGICGWRCHRHAGGDGRRRVRHGAGAGNPRARRRLHGAGHRHASQSARPGHGQQRLAEGCAGGDLHARSRATAAPSTTASPRPSSAASRAAGCPAWRQNAPMAAGVSAGARSSSPARRCCASSPPPWCCRRATRRRQGELVSAIVEGGSQGLSHRGYLERCARAARLRQLCGELRRACSCPMHASSSA